MIQMRPHPLAQAIGSHKVLTDLPQRKLYRYDGIAVGQTPAVVVLPENTQDVVEVVRYAQATGLPIVPRGAASGLSGGAVPLQESIVLSFTRMTQLQLLPPERKAIAQVGVITGSISEQAKPFGLQYPPDPASLRTSTIGGNMAENAGGPMCFKKGVTGDYVLGLEFVDDEGQVHQLGREAYDYPGLLIGSEGTLGLITQATLRLSSIPKHSRTLIAHFAEVGQAADAVSQAIASGAVPAKLEFLDQGCIRAVEDYLHVGLPTQAGALLLVDTDGDDLEIVEEELSWVAEACRNLGGSVQLAQNPQHAESLWRARRSVSPALARIRPQRMNEDIAVPRSKLPQVVREIEALGRENNFTVVQFGHIGDGNLHPNILFDPATESIERVWELAHEVARIALRHGGVLSGEHGIGTTKREFMAEALDADSLKALWALKHIIDPHERFNPGKVLPPL